MQSLRHKPALRHCAAGAVCAVLTLPLQAQVSATTGTLSEVTVTGNPLGAAEPITPALRVQGAELLLRSRGTLGETLQGLPGVSSTHFGPNVSRPVIRGFDGDRIRILRNGGASIDASALSFDHAVPSDPISVEGVEVLRGPAALMYGGNAIGGVVNLIDNRIPRAPGAGLTGRADASLASGNRERGGAAMLETGSERWALHVDAHARRAGDVRVPAEVPCDAGTVRLRRICNTGLDTRGAALGGSWFGEHGWIGASTSGLRSDYGSAAEEDVTLRMRSQRHALEGQWRPTRGPITGLRLQASQTNYRHTEFEDGQPGTTFRNRGHDVRLELRHQPIGPWSGVLGLQGERTRFSADGEEAFAPYSRTGMQALFLHEEVDTRWGRFSAGARRESVRVESLGHPIIARLATGERRYAPVSYSVGALWKLAPAWQLTASAGHSERAPRDYELYADGPHVATGAWEVGDRQLGKERSNHAEVGLAWKGDPHSLRLGAWTSRFGRYIALAPTGVTRTTDDGDDLPEFAYRGVQARFHGLEASGTWRLLRAAPMLDLEWRADVVRATDANTGEPLPRIAPARLGATLVASQGPWSLRLGADGYARQSRVPAGSSETAGYVLWNAALTWRQPAPFGQLLWYARVDNIADTAARSATSILTQTAPERAWLAGRSMRVGVRADF